VRGARLIEGFLHLRRNAPLCPQKNPGEQRGLRIREVGEKASPGAFAQVEQSLKQGVGLVTLEQLDRGILHQAVDPLPREVVEVGEGLILRRRLKLSKGANPIAIPPLGRPRRLDKDEAAHLSRGGAFEGDETFGAHPQQGELVADIGRLEDHAFDGQISRGVVEGSKRARAQGRQCRPKTGGPQTEHQKTGEEEPVPALGSQAQAGGQGDGGENQPLTDGEAVARPI
jgi:hypothetical protein